MAGPAVARPSPAGPGQRPGRGRRRLRVPPQPPPPWRLPAAPAPRGSAGPQQDQPCPGGASAESGGAAPDPHSEPADTEAILNPPGREGTPGSSGRKKREKREQRAPGSPCQEPPSLPFTLSPLPGSPRGRRRSWRRSSLRGRRSRRRSLPPLHRDLTELSRSISLELPEIQRLCLLLLSSFQFSARKLQQALEGSPGFDPGAFTAKVRAGLEQLQLLLQRLLQDGTLGSCLEPLPGDSLDPALEGSVVQVKQLMASLSGELQAWEGLLQQHLQRSQSAARSLEQLRAGDPPQDSQIPEFPGFSQIPEFFSQILDSKPDYGAALERLRPALPGLRLLVAEAQQAGQMALQLHRDSRAFLRGLSEQLASRAFRQLQGSPARRLLEQRPRQALPAQGQQ